MKKTVISIFVVLLLLVGTIAIASVSGDLDVTVPGYQYTWNYNAAAGQRSLAYSYVEVKTPTFSNSATSVYAGVFYLGSNTSIATPTYVSKANTYFTKVYLNEGYLNTVNVRIGLRGTYNYTSSYIVHMYYDLR